MLSHLIARTRLPKARLRRTNQSLRLSSGMIGSLRARTVVAA